MHARIALTLTLAAGCGSVEYTHPPDAGSDDDVDAEVAAADAEPGPACDVTRPWGTPAPLAGVNTNRIDMSARLSPDELTIYFQSDRDTPSGTTVDLYVATRASIDDGFGAPARLDTVSTADNDGDPSISADGLTLFAGRSTAGFTDGDIYVATRATTLGAFGAPALATVSQSTTHDNQPFDAGGGLWFTSQRPGGLGGLDIYRAPITGGVLGTPVAVTELNTASEDWLPMLTADERTVYFGSTRPDPDAPGLFDIWTSTRPDTASEFAAPTLVPELSSPFQDFPSWISPDGCRLYLTSERLGSPDIYLVERSDQSS